MCDSPICDGFNKEEECCEFCHYPPGAHPCPAEGDYACMRPLGHPGPHVACGFKGYHKICTWEN